VPEAATQQQWVAGTQQQSGVAQQTLLTGQHLACREHGQLRLWVGSRGKECVLDEGTS
jgi:hypothetical protein